MGIEQTKLLRGKDPISFRVEDSHLGGFSSNRSSVQSILYDVEEEDESEEEEWLEEDNQDTMEDDGMRSDSDGEVETHSGNLDLRQEVKSRVIERVRFRIGSATDDSADEDDKKEEDVKIGLT